MSDEFWLPTDEGNGTRYHSRLCGAHNLEPVPEDEARERIAEEGLIACRNCLVYHDLHRLAEEPVIVQRGTLSQLLSLAYININKGLIERDGHFEDAIDDAETELDGKSKHE